MGHLSHRDHRSAARDKTRGSQDPKRVDSTATTQLLTATTTTITDRCIVFGLIGAMAGICEEQLHDALARLGNPELLVIAVHSRPARI